MRELLEACLDLDVLAGEVYRRFALDTHDPSLAALFDLMRAEEDQHSIWWAELLDACIKGDLDASLQPAPHVVTYLRAVTEMIRCTLKTEFAGFSDEDRLAVAASLEFFGLDPAFARLIGASDPGGDFGHRDAYDAHLKRLVEAMESRRAWALVSQIALLRALGEEPAGSTRLRDDRTGLPSAVAATAVLSELCGREAVRGEFVSLALIDVATSQSPGALSDKLADDNIFVTTSLMHHHLGPGNLMFRDERGRFGAVMPAASADTAGKAMSELVEAIRDGLGTCDGSATPEPRIRVAVLTVAPGAPQRCDAQLMMSDTSGVLERMRSDEATAVETLSLD